MIALEKILIELKVFVMNVLDERKLTSMSDLILFQINIGYDFKSDLVKHIYIYKFLVGDKRVRV